MLAESLAAGTIPEYSAAEAPRNISAKKPPWSEESNAFLRVEHFIRSIFDGCSPNSPFWIIVNDNASGPELNVQDLKGVIVAVSGQIEKRDAYSHPWMVVKSTVQIQARTALKTDHISRGHEKGSRGDLDAAIAEFGHAIEEQPDRRAEVYELRGRTKERKGDWNGALADYDALVALDPKKADSYDIRAMQKKQHGDFEDAMADFGKAAELRSSASDYIQMGNWRKEQGDKAGAAAENQKAIALCDRQIAGIARSNAASPLGTDPYFSRGDAKELKGDLDGAVADYSRAIANNPGRAGMAFGARGNIRKARGDLAGAISDYQHKYQITDYPDDEKLLREVRAELRNSGNTKNKTSQDVVLNAAKAEYEASSHDETARVRYVTKLAKMHAQVLEDYWKTHDKMVFASDVANAVDEELYKHPAPSDVNSGKLSQLLIGHW